MVSATSSEKLVEDVGNIIKQKAIKTNVRTIIPDFNGLPSPLSILNFKKKYKSRV